MKRSKGNIHKLTRESDEIFRFAEN